MTLLSESGKLGNCSNPVSAGEKTDFNIINTGSNHCDNSINNSFWIHRQVANRCADGALSIYLLDYFSDQLVIECAQRTQCRLLEVNNVDLYI